MSFFAALGLDVRHFGPMWHILKVAQLVETDLNRISSAEGLSIADFHLLSALMMEGDKPLTATDLALTLNVSNAALTKRVQKLTRQGLLLRQGAECDRRAVMLHLTLEGAAKVRSVASAIEREGLFVRYFRSLSEADRLSLGRVLGDLHTRVERHFDPASRSEA